MVNSEPIFSARFPAELVDELKLIAERDSCSLSSVVRRACIQYVAERKLENRKREPARILIQTEED